MPSIETSIWLALRARVESLALSPVHTVSYPNEAFTPPQTTVAPILPLPYLRVTHFLNTPNRPFLKGSDPHQRRGILQVAVMSPLNQQNSAIAIEVAGQVAAHFPADLPMRYGGLTVKVEKAPDVMRGLRDEESSRWMTPVSIRWECFI